MSVHFHSSPNLSNLRTIFQKSNKLSFSVIHLNIRSLKKYWDYFQVITAGITDLVDAFVLTEINVDDSMTGQFCLPGYQARFFTRAGRRGGGIATFIKMHWTATPLQIHFTAAECLAFRLEYSDSALSLIAIYRPPSENPQSFLGELRDNLSQLQSCSNVCLIGDINIDILKSSKPIVTNYLNLLAEHGIESIVNEATREEMLLDKCVASCLDHVLVRASDYEDVISVLIAEKIADHYFVGCQIYSPEASKPAETKSTFVKIFDRTQFDRLVSEYNWNSVFAQSCPIKAYEHFLEVFADFKEASKREVMIKKRKPNYCWLNDSILAAIKEKEDLWKRSRQSPGNDFLKKLYRTARNKVTALIRSSRRQHYNTQFSLSKDNPSRVWSLINQLRGNQTRNYLDPIIKGFGDATDKVADHLNDYFSSMSTSPINLETASCPILPQPAVTDSAYLPSLGPEDLYRLIRLSRKKRSTGLDGICADDVWRNLQVLTDPLLFILNGIIDSRIIPSDMKRAKVIPLFKTGDASKPENYRPISVLPLLAQVLERHVLEVMMGFVQKHSLLSPYQYGFIPERGTQKLFEELSDYLHEALEKNQVACALFLDLSKAFDSVSHDILCSKLCNYGFRGHFHDFLKNYLADRSQVVCLKAAKSSLRGLHSGVPQGSVLSPLLFNLYVNDFSSAISKCTLFQYADDTLIVSRHINYEDATVSLQQDAIQAMNWFEGNQIKVNPKKTQLLCIRNPLKIIHTSVPILLHTDKCLPCNCTPVVHTDCVKYLGILFDSDMTWNSHMASLCARLRSVACLLYRIRALVPLKVKKMIVHALAYSHIRYGIRNYFNCSSFWKAKIDSLLKNILRSIAYNTNLSSDISLFRALNLPNFETLFQCTVVPTYFWNKNFLIPNSKEISLRNIPRYVVPRVRTRYGECRRAYYVPKIFNQLPQSVLNQETLTGIKQALLDLIS